MGVLTASDVAKHVKAMNNLYQPDGRCSAIADRPHMRALVARLSDYTDQVEEEANRLGLVDDLNVAQWAIDLASWRERLASYQQSLEEETGTTGHASCEELYDTVVGPLLDGNYAKAPVTSGIMNPAVRSVPDVATPYMLGNQVVTYREFQAQNFEALIGYFVDEARALRERVVSATKSAAPSILAIGVGLALGAAALVYLGKNMNRRVGATER